MVKTKEKKRYSKNNEEMVHTTTTLRKDVMDLIYKYMKENRIRNRTVAIENLVVKALEAEGYKIE